MNVTAKAKLFGTASKPKATGDFIVDRETALAPLVGDQTVIRACCTGCGKCLELLESGAKRLAKMAGVEEPEIWGAYYIEAKRCPICDQDYREVTLKPIG